MLNYRFFKKLKLLKKVDMENGWVELSSSQVNRVVGKKWVILNWLKTSLGQLGCGSDQVDLYFSHDFYFFIYIKKKTCIYHLESHATNHLM